MNGFAVLEALRQDPRTATLPSVMLSALTSEEIEARCAELGAVAYVRKPSEADALLGASASALSRPSPVALPGRATSRDA